MTEKDHLYILWTSADPITAEKMIVMYAGNSLKHGWWQKVTLIVWGAATQLVGNTPAMQQQMKDLLAGGVHVTACKRCSDELGTTAQLEALGIEVIYWGEPLTQVLKSEAKLLTV